MEWSIKAEIDGVSHNVTISPKIDVLNITNTSVCFIAPYSIVHNVSIISIGCGMYAVSAVLEVYYGKRFFAITATKIVYAPHSHYVYTCLMYCA